MATLATSLKQESSAQVPAMHGSHAIKFNGPWEIGWFRGAIAAIRFAAEIATFPCHTRLLHAGYLPDALAA